MKSIDRISIRPETNADVSAIAALTAAAFKSLAISDKTEQFVIEALRSAGALTVSLVAELDGRVVGHVAVSPVTISDGSEGWYALGPVSVEPTYQNSGIGSALIAEALRTARALGARGCCLVGHPGYYTRFGFGHELKLVCEGVPPEVFFTLRFSGNSPSGVVTFHEAFRATAPADPPAGAGNTAAGPSD